MAPWGFFLSKRAWRHEKAKFKRKKLFIQTNSLIIFTFPVLLVLDFGQVG
jgi:hypothetical protein